MPNVERSGGRMGVMKGLRWMRVWGRKGEALDDGRATGNG